MKQQPESAKARPSHLRLVSPPPTADCVRATPSVVPAPAELRAQGIRAEMAAFAAVRGASEKFAAAAGEAGGRGHPITAPSGLPTASEATAADLGPRYEALAAEPSGCVAAAEIDRRFDQAVEGLRPVRPSDPGSLRPAAGMRLLADSNPAAAGRWLLASLPLLHQAAPMAVLELRLDRRTTLRGAALGNETRIDLAAVRNRRLPRVNGGPAKLAEQAFGSRRVPRAQRRGVQLLRRLAAHPLSLRDLRDSGSAALDPISFWQLIAVVVPAVPDGVGGLLLHRDPSREGYDVAVDLSPGCPVRLRSAAGVEGDAELTCEARGTLEWACSGQLGGGGTDWLSGGDPDLETLALRTVASAAAGPVSPIRSQS